MKEITVSVRNLIEFILRSGDLTTGSFLPKSDSQTGIKLHQKIQKKEKKAGGYEAEVRLKHSVEFEDMKITIQGIADGVIRRNGITTIDEIKTTAKKIEDIPESDRKLHLAQAMFYALFLCEEEGLECISVRISYCNTETGDVEYFESEHTLPELYELFCSVVNEYRKWINFRIEDERVRNLSEKQTVFPYSEFRPGQRDMSAAIYVADKKGKTVFVQAPTGTGKTVSALFPSVKAQGEDLCDAVFYLTSKDTIKTAAENCISLMQDKGLSIRFITITSKEKICEYNQKCNPETCPFAKGHFDRINEAVFALVKENSRITRNTVEQYSRKYNVCPFELTLDASEWCDIVICDYNYAFDPRSRLQRYFGTEQTRRISLLCDECHNLVDRGREMFSASLNANELDISAKHLKKAVPSLSRKLKKTARIIRNHIDSNQTEETESIINSVTNCIDSYAAFLARDGFISEKERTVNTFFDLCFFSDIHESRDESYKTLLSEDRITLFCTDPSDRINETVRKCSSASFFSATLIPPDYYYDLLGGRKNESGFYSIPSPFPRENLFVSAWTGISTKYTDRDSSMEKLADFIHNCAYGNTLVFFPSYKYMNDIFDFMTGKYGDAGCRIQRQDFTEEEKNAFLDNFREDSAETDIAFAVMGGIFSEGIDLGGTKLNGVIIVGVGLPQIGPERDAIRDHFNDEERNGFDYAYVYPGFTRVMQSVGRVIRSAQDRGFAVLCDKRYEEQRYRRMFPDYWDVYYSESGKDIPEKIHEHLDVPGK